jgi:hypothetical protein
MSNVPHPPEPSLIFRNCEMALDFKMKLPKSADAAKQEKKITIKKA